MRGPIDLITGSCIHQSRHRQQAAAAGSIDRSTGLDSRHVSGVRHIPTQSRSEPLPSPLTPSSICGLARYVAKVGLAPTRFTPWDRIDGPIRPFFDRSIDSMPHTGPGYILHRCRRLCPRRHPYHTLPQYRTALGKMRLELFFKTAGELQVRPQPLLSYWLLTQRVMGRIYTSYIHTHTPRPIY